MSEDNNGHSVTRQDLREAIEGLTEAIRGVETNLLTEFHRYARGVAQRLHTHDVSAHDLAERMHLLEQRVLELEGRIRPKL